MGSFNVACTLSRMSISEGDKMVMIPLINGIHSKYLQYNESTLISNEGIYLAYIPITLPIFGVYGDYGNITKIVEDDNTKAIEEHFGMNIKNFCNIITCNRKGFTDKYSALYQLDETHPDHADLLYNSACMFIHGDIYEKLIKAYKNPKGYAKTDSTLAYNSWDVYLTHDLLLKLGFNKTDEDLRGDDHQSKRYKKIYRYQDRKDFYIGSDGRFTRFVMDSDKDGRYESCHRLIDLNERFKMLGIDYDFEFYKNITKYELDYDLFRDLLINQLDESSSNISKLSGFAREFVDELRAEGNKTEKEIEETLEACKHLLDHGNPFTDNGVWNRLEFDRYGKYKNHMLYKIYRNTIVKEDSTIKKTLTDYLAIADLMYSCNAHLGPCIAGPQCGDQFATYELGKAIKEVSHSKIESYGDSDYNDYEF